MPEDTAARAQSSHCYFRCLGVGLSLYRVFDAEKMTENDFSRSRQRHRVTNLVSSG